MTTFKSVGINVKNLKSRLEKIQGRQKETVKTVVSKLTASIGLPEVDSSLGAYQRLQFRIPTDDRQDGTVISAGRRQNKRNYDGLGITTNRHVIVSAEGGKENSTMTLQSNGQLTLQSDDDSLYAVAKGPASVVSSSAVNLVGAGGVVIDGGLVPTIKNVVIEGSEPGFPKALDGHGDHMSQASDSWKSWDQTIQKEAEDRDSAQTEMDPAVAQDYAPVHQATNLASLASTTLSANNKLGTAQEQPNGAVAIQGAGGFIIGTPASGAIRTDNALILSAKNSAIFGTDTVDVHSTKTASLTSLDQTSVHAGKNLNLVAMKNRVHIGARSGDPVEIQARDIHIGEMQPMTNPQTPTDNVSVRARQHVSLATENDPNRQLSGEGVYVDSHRVIECKAADTLTFLIAGQEIKVVIEKNNNISIKAGDASITVNASGGVTTKHQSAEVKAAVDTVTVKGSKINLNAASDAVKVNGKTIKLN